MAITSPTDVCNLAQIHLRQNPIADIDNPTSKSEATYAQIYDQVRRVTLEMHPWNFASKRTTIASSADTPTHKWGHASALLPSDFVRLNTIGPDDDWYSEMYALEGNRILSNEPAPYYIQYVYDMTDVARMSPLFIQTFAKMLAAFAAFQITGNAALKEVLSNEASAELDAAMGSDGQQRPPVRRQVSKWNLSRRRAGYFGNQRYLGGP